MYGYKLKINCIPEILWACETTVTDYYWEKGAQDIKDAIGKKIDAVFCIYFLYL